MDDEFRRRWKNEACGFFVEAHEGSRAMGPLRSSLSRMLATLVGTLPDGWDEWGEREQRTAMDGLCPVHDHAGADTVRLAYRCVRMGHAIALGSTRGLSPSEARYLGPHMRRLGHATVERRDRPGPRPRAGPTFDLAVAFTYLGIPQGMRSPRRYAATTPATVERVPREAFRTAGRLARPGGAVQVLLRDGTWYRPVLGPGGWDPLDEPGFVLACSGRDPWRDAPHELDRRGVLLAPFEHRTGGPHRALDRDEAAAAAAAAAGRVVSVNGSVHLASPAPTFHLVARRTLADPPRLALEWRMGRLTSGDDMGTLTRLAGSTVEWGPGPDPSGGGAYPAFPAPCLSLAREVGRATAALAAMDFDESSATGMADVGPHDRARVLLDVLRAMPGSGRPDAPQRALTDAMSATRGEGQGAADAIRAAATAIGPGPDERGGSARYGALLRTLGLTVARALEEVLADERDVEASLAAMAP